MMLVPQPANLQFTNWRGSISFSAILLDGKRSNALLISTSSKRKISCTTLLLVKTINQNKQSNFTSSCVAQYLSVSVEIAHVTKICKPINLVDKRDEAFLNSLWKL